MLIHHDEENADRKSPGFGTRNRKQKWKQPATASTKEFKKTTELILYSSLRSGKEHKRTEKPKMTMGKATGSHNSFGIPLLSSTRNNYVMQLRRDYHVLVMMNTPCSGISMLLLWLLNYDHWAEFNYSSISSDMNYRGAFSSSINFVVPAANHLQPF